MSAAQDYYESLIAQGFPPDQALQHTQYYYPYFTGLPPMPAVVYLPQQSKGSPSSKRADGIIALFCILLTLILSIWGAFGKYWIEMDDDNVESWHVGLRTIHVVIDIDDYSNGEMTCKEYIVEMEDDDRAKNADIECNGDVAILSIPIDEEYCDSFDSKPRSECNEIADAGIAATFCLSLAILVGLAATTLIYCNVFGIDFLYADTKGPAMITAIISGVLAGLSVFLWWTMIPEIDDSAKVGVNVGLTLIGSITGIISGVLIRNNGREFVPDYD